MITLHRRKGRAYSCVHHDVQLLLHYRQEANQSLHTWAIKLHITYNFSSSVGSHTIFWVYAFLTILIHTTLSMVIPIQFSTPIFFRFSSTLSLHFFLCLTYIIIWKRLPFKSSFYNSTPIYMRNMSNLNNT